MIYPHNPTDGQIVVDPNGDRYRYYVDLNQWINIGSVIQSQLVSYHQNGLISPAIVNLLFKINLSDNFKISENQNVYYYLLKATGRLFKFNIENANLHIELYRNALTNALIGRSCPGLKGQEGPQGITGINGLLGPNESIYLPEINGNLLFLSVDVPTPLSTPISIRLYNNTSSDIIEILFDISTGNWEVMSGSEIDETASSVEYSGGKLTCTIIRFGAWGFGWTAKARQLGPIGLPGNDGNQFLAISNIYADIVKSTEAVNSLRFADSDLFFVRTNLVELPTARLRPYQSSLTSNMSNNALTVANAFVAVQPSVDSNKGIMRWIYESIEYSKDNLNLPVWVPDPSCGNEASFEWWNNINTSIPFRMADALPKKCCQEDFFFCISNDDPCGITQSTSSSSS